MKKVKCLINIAPFLRKLGLNVCVCVNYRGTNTALS